MPWVISRMVFTIKSRIAMVHLSVVLSHFYFLTTTIEGLVIRRLFMADGGFVSETIRDLIRFLRNDNNILLARKICGERNIIENDLIPIIKTENLKDKMFDIALRFALILRTFLHLL